MNYLGELGSKLRDLRGTATLAHELIQDAEDAIKDIEYPKVRQSAITFRVSQQPLIVDKQLPNGQFMTSPFVTVTCRKIKKTGCCILPRHILEIFKTN